MKNVLKGLGVGIALTLVWTFFYFTFYTMPLIGKLSDFEHLPATYTFMRTRVFYWTVVGLLFVLAFWLTRARKRNTRPDLEV